MSVRKKILVEMDLHRKRIPNTSTDRCRCRFTIEDFETTREGNFDKDKTAKEIFDYFLKDVLAEYKEWLGRIETHSEEVEIEIQ